MFSPPPQTHMACTPTRQSLQASSAADSGAQSNDAAMHAPMPAPARTPARALMLSPGISMVAGVPATPVAMPVGDEDEAFSGLDAIEDTSAAIGLGPHSAMRLTDVRLTPGFNPFTPGSINRNPATRPDSHNGRFMEALSPNYYISEAGTLTPGLPTVPTPGAGGAAGAPSSTTNIGRTLNFNLAAAGLCPPLPSTATSSLLTESSTAAAAAAAAGMRNSQKRSLSCMYLDFEMNPSSSSFTGSSKKTKAALQKQKRKDFELRDVAGVASPSTGGLAASQSGKKPPRSGKKASSAKRALAPAPVPAAALHETASQNMQVAFASTLSRAPGKENAGNAIISSAKAPTLESSGVASALSGGGKKRKRNESGVACKCKKSGCLQMYCDCFAAQVSCGAGCSCKDCKNTVENADIVDQARRRVKSNNAHAFCEKVVVDEEGKRHHTRGCHCRNSKCLKKYCECFASGAKCTHKCKCVDCKNGKPDGAPPSQPPQSGSALVCQNVSTEPSVTASESQSCRSHTQVTSSSGSSCSAATVAVPSAPVGGPSSSLVPAASSGKAAPKPAAPVVPKAVTNPAPVSAPNPKSVTVPSSGPSVGNPSGMGMGVQLAREHQEIYSLLQAVNDDDMQAMLRHLNIPQHDIDTAIKSAQSMVTQGQQIPTVTVMPSMPMACAPTMKAKYEPVPARHALPKQKQSASGQTSQNKAVPQSTALPLSPVLPKREHALHPADGQDATPARPLLVGKLVEAPHQHPSVMPTQPRQGLQISPRTLEAPNMSVMNTSLELDGDSSLLHSAERHFPMHGMPIGGAEDGEGESDDRQMPFNIMGTDGTSPLRAQAINLRNI